MRGERQLENGLLRKHLDKIEVELSVELVQKTVFLGTTKKSTRNLPTRKLKDRQHHLPRCLFYITIIIMMMKINNTTTVHCRYQSAITSKRSRERTL